MKTKSHINHTLARERMAVLGLSVSGLARECKLPERTIARWLAGHSVPTAANLMRLAEVLGVHPEQIYTWVASDAALDKTERGRHENQVQT